jgi:uncharacterized protein
MTAQTIHDQAYEFYSWETLGGDIFNLARDIIDSGKNFDRVVALAKGGLTFSRSLVDFLGIPDVSSIQIEFYTGINETNRIPVITQSLPVTIQNERILIFDDIVDKGVTLELAVQYLKQHGPAEVTTASLLYKPWSTIKPDFIARTSEAWVIFPNEIRETIEILVNKWGQQGDSTEQIANQLLQIGFSKAEVELFANFK